MTKFEQLEKSMKRGLFTVWGFSVVASFLLLATPLYMSSVYDRVLSSNSLSTLAVLTLLACGALVAHGAIDAVRRMILSRMATKLDAEVSSYVIENALSNEAARPTKSIEGIGHLSTLRNFITGPASIAVFDLPIAPIFIVLMFFVSPVLGIVTLLGVGILAFMAILNQRLSDPLTKEANGHSQKANQIVSVLTRNSEPVRAMGMMNNSITLWGEPQAKALISAQDATKRLSWLTSTSKVTRMLLQVAVLGVGALLVLQGDVSPGLIFVSSIVSGRALQPVDGIIAQWKTITSARTAYSEISALLKSIGPEQKRMRYSRPSGETEVDQVSYHIEGSPKPILQGFSFSIPAGRSIGLIGPSGAGKSTLARILAGAIQPTDGVIKYDRIDISTWDRSQLGGFVGYVPQDIELFPGTIADNIARMDPDLSSEAVIEVSQMTGIHDFIQSLPNGYNTEVGPGQFQPSGGQRQRIAIARAFYGMPSIIVMDEPNANLDGMGENALMHAIAMAKGWGATIVVVSHRPQLLQAVDTLLVIAGGRIVEYGPRDEVMNGMKSNSIFNTGPGPKAKPAPAKPAAKRPMKPKPAQTSPDSISTAPVASFNDDLASPLNHYR